jgi:menaquinone-9 beta-reductase
VWFEPDLLPGYVWSFPLPGGRANVGFGIARRGRFARGPEVGRVWRTLLDRPHIRQVLGESARPEAPQRSWPIPARVTAVPLVGRRTLFVGDAAAATDPMTGEGIAQALLTGMLAAEAIVPAGTADAPDAIDASESPDSVTRRYRRAVRRELAADHRLSQVCAAVLRHRIGVEAGLRLVGISERGRRAFARWLVEDCPRAVVGTPRRWRRGALFGPGAFDSQDAAEPVVSLGSP